MDASPRLRLRQLPLGYRLLALMLGAALMVAVLVTLEVSDRNARGRLATMQADAERCVAQLAVRAAPHLAADDDLRLALVATAARDVLGDVARVRVADAHGRLRFDSAAMDGLGESEGQKAASLRVETSTFAMPCVVEGRTVGEVRLTLGSPSSLASFPWGVFGLVFLTSLSLVCLAVAVCHHWLARVGEIAETVRQLARGEVRSAGRVDAPGVIGELQAAVGDVSQVMQAGIEGVRESAIQLGLALVDQVERRDQTPPGHCERTARYAGLLADRLSMCDDDRRDLELAARLHDVGKVAIRAALLEKKGPLTEEERATLRQHPDRGASFFAGVPQLQRVAQTIRHHHEKYDGTGYPDGLRGERIPLEARILAIADAYDVLTSRGMNGAPLGWSQALERMRCDRGEHFDPWLFDLFAGAIQSAPVPEQPVRMLVISPQGVVPYKAAEPTPLERELDASLDEEEILEAMSHELEVMHDDQRGEG
ncbi:MAG: HD domain-containing phosphohydrolase [Planctomycetota bacterium]